jgi:hypothetical protein
MRELSRQRTVPYRDRRRMALDAINENLVRRRGEETMANFMVTS